MCCCLQVLCLGCFADATDHAVSPHNPCAVYFAVPEQEGKLGGQGSFVEAEVCGYDDPRVQQALQAATSREGGYWASILSRFGPDSPFLRPSEHSSLRPGTRVAIKVPNVAGEQQVPGRAAADGGRLCSMLLEESLSTAQLAHPNIVTGLATAFMEQPSLDGMHHRNVPIMVTQLCDCNLEDLWKAKLAGALKRRQLERHQKRGAKFGVLEVMSQQEAMSYVKPVMVAAKFLHSRDCVHR